MLDGHDNSNTVFPILGRGRQLLRSPFQFHSHGLLIVFRLTCVFLCNTSNFKSRTFLGFHRTW